VALSKSVPEHGTAPVFEDVPTFRNGEAVLFDSAAGGPAGKVPDAVTLTALELEFPDGAPGADQLDAGLVLLVFVDDLAAPRARVGLADLVRQGGKRPLNVRRQGSQPIRIVLTDGNGSWSQGARIRVSLGWNGA
jgi:Ca-activated chloride channel family protein